MTPLRTPSYTISRSSTNTGACLEVEKLDEAVAHLRSHGVKIVMDIQDFPFCRMALVADPDGNTLALHQRKENHPENSTG